MDQVNEFLMGFNTGRADVDLVGRDVLELELLENIGVQVLHVTAETLERETEST